MPEFLSDPQPSIYLILAVMAVIMAGIALRTRKKGDWIRLGMAGVLLVVLLLIDKTTESPRETVVRKVKAIESAVTAHNYTEMQSHLSDQFQFKSLKKKDLADRARQAEQFLPSGISCWELTRANFEKVSDTKVRQGFLAQPAGSGNPTRQRYVIAEFQKEADGEWRMTTFQLYDPLKRNDAPAMDVPGL